MKNTIVVDIDGTISNDSHRKHYLTGKVKNWEAYFGASIHDEPVKDVIELVNRLWESGMNVVFCTGRPEYTRDITINWIWVHFPTSFTNEMEYSLIMRPSGNTEGDDTLKVKMLEEAGYSPDDVLFVIDDRNRVVKSWREAGYTCLQPVEGNF
jgi:phosphoglycolate phosphatase-like HAD superfamily hydrolase